MGAGTTQIGRTADLDTGPADYKSV